MKPVSTTRTSTTCPAPRSVAEPAGRRRRPASGIRVPLAFSWRGSIVAILGSDPHEWARLQESMEGWPPVAVGVTRLDGRRLDWTPSRSGPTGSRPWSRSMVELQEGLRVAEEDRPAWGDRRRRRAQRRTTAARATPTWRPRSSIENSGRCWRTRVSAMSWSRRSRSTTTSAATDARQPADSTWRIAPWRTGSSAPRPCSATASTANRAGDSTWR